MSKHSTKVSILSLVFLGLVIRLLLALFPGFLIDINDWFAWAARLSLFDFAHFYSKDVFTDYTPGYLYILSLLGFLKSFLGLEDNLFYFLLKIPAIISDLIISLLVYKELEKPKAKLALLATFLIICNPAFIFNSAIWGQIDSVFSLFLLSSIIFLRKDRLAICSIFFSIAFLIKPQAISIAPIFFLFLIKNFSFKNIIKITLPGFATAFILALPFFPNNPIYGLFQKIMQTASEYPYISLNAYNIWGIVGFWISDKESWNGLTYQVWGNIIFAAYWFMLSYFYIKGKLSIYSLATLATLGFFFLPTKVHERYLYPSLVFLIILAFKYRTKTLVVLVSLVNFLHLANLYYVYIYYNKIYFKFSDSLYFQPLYSFLASQPILLSVISSLVFILISIIIIKFNYGHQKDSI